MRVRPDASQRMSANVAAAAISLGSGGFGNFGLGLKRRFRCGLVNRCFGRLRCRFGRLVCPCKCPEGAERAGLLGERRNID